MKGWQEPGVCHRGRSCCVAKQGHVTETNPPVPPILLDQYRHGPYGPLRLTTAYLPTISLTDHCELIKGLKEMHGLVILQDSGFGRDPRCVNLAIMSRRGAFKHRPAVVQTCPSRIVLVASVRPSSLFISPRPSQLLRSPVSSPREPQPLPI